MGTIHAHIYNNYMCPLYRCIVCSYIMYTNESNETALPNTQYLFRLISSLDLHLGFHRNRVIY